MILLRPVNFYFTDVSEPSHIIFARSAFILPTSQNRHSSSFCEVKEKNLLHSYYIGKPAFYQEKNNNFDFGIITLSFDRWGSVDGNGGSVNNGGKHHYGVGLVYALLRLDAVQKLRQGAGIIGLYL